MTTIVNWGLATDIGRVRGRNEDSALAQPPIFVVADGMGGHTGGEVASALAISEFAELVDRPTVTREDVAAAIDRGNARILDEARERGGAPGMGTTLAGIAIVAPGGIDHWLAFNVGDSRVYRWANGHLEQITVDHSEVQELVAAGEITPSEARSHRLRSVVTRALGVDPAPEADSWLVPMIAGERFLICSDGLFAELSETEIADALLTPSPTTAAALLVERAVTAGGKDNVTVITVDVEHAPGGDSGIDEDTLPRLEITLPLTDSPISELPGVDL